MMDLHLNLRRHTADTGREASLWSKETTNET